MFCFLTMMAVAGIALHGQRWDAGLCVRAEQRAVSRAEQPRRGDLQRGQPRVLRRGRPVTGGPTVLIWSFARCVQWIYRIILRVKHSHHITLLEHSPCLCVRSGSVYVALSDLITAALESRPHPQHPQAATYSSVRTTIEDGIHSTSLVNNYYLFQSSFHRLKGILTTHGHLYAWERFGDFYARSPLRLGNPNAILVELLNLFGLLDKPKMIPISGFAKLIVALEWQ